ncbi:MAG TPA: NAD(P)-dependent oxidoreductase [Aestuariivirga sp.]
MQQRRPKKDKRIRVALTGATGFSGSFILPQLLAAGYDVVALARKPEVLSGKCKNVVAGDLSDDVALTKLVEGCKVVMHVGGATSAKSRKEFFDVNLEGTKRLFAAAKRAHVRRFVYVSSLTAREPKLSDYGASKAAAEQFLLPLDDDKTEVLILRPPAIYGPGDSSSLPLFKAVLSRTAYFPGPREGRFSLLYVGDFAKVVCEAVDSTAHAVFELDDQSLGYSWDDLATIARRHYGTPKKVVYLPRGIVHTVAGLAELGARLTGKAAFTTRQKVNEVYHPDWVAKGLIWPVLKPVKLEQGMAQTVAWYRAHGWLKAESEKAKGSA